MKLQKDLREFIELLNSHKVEYLIVGGHAVAFYGYPRYTGDIDFFIRADDQNASRVVAVLKEFGFSDADKLATALTEPEKIVQLGWPPNRIDLLTSISGIAFDEAAAVAVSGEIDGVPVQFPSLDSLLQNKRASGRTKDLADVEQLEKRDKQE